MATVQLQTQSNSNQSNTRTLFPSERKELSTSEQEALASAFPPVNPGFIPNGNRVLVQLRSAVTVTKGGIHLTGESIDAQLYEEQIGRVVAMGGATFRNPANMEPWAEGEWFSVGDYVRVPKFGGDKTWTIQDGNQKTLFVVFRDYDIIGTIFGNPLDIKGYI